MRGNTKSNYIRSKICPHTFLLLVVGVEQLFVNLTPLINSVTTSKLLNIPQPIFFTFKEGVFGLL